MSWKAITHSAIGTRHVAKEMPCQDFGAFQVREGLIFGAIADGAGSAKYSDLGAQIAVETWIDAAIHKWESQDCHLDAIDQQDFHALFQEISSAVVARLEAEAAQGEYSIRELGCTLLSFIAAESWVAAMQIGDGFIVCQTLGSDEYELLFRPDKGEYINETLFVTSQGALDALQSTFVAESPEFICAATDGLEKVAISYQTWLPHRPFFKPFKDCMALIPNVDDQQAYIQTFLESDRLNARTDDDKTLLLCLAVNEEAG